MTQSQIQELFNETLHKTKALHNKVQDFSEDTLYNWRKGRTTPKLGDMLSILYQLKLIKVEDNG